MSGPGNQNDGSETHQKGPTPQLHSDIGESQYPSGHATTERGRADTGSKCVLDIDDIAELFHCSREKVKRMARSGELPAFKFGKRWYVLRDDLEHFLSDKVESNRHLRRIQEVSP